MSLLLTRCLGCGHPKSAHEDSSGACAAAVGLCRCKCPAFRSPNSPRARNAAARRADFKDNAKPKKSKPAPSPSQPTGEKPCCDNGKMFTPHDCQKGCPEEKP